MLAWDRIVGNLLEQAMPFLTLFWVNTGLAALGATRYERVAAAGWVYVVFRALYPVSPLRMFAPSWDVISVRWHFNFEGRGRRRQRERLSSCCNHPLACS